jgi:CDGSH-type Zn-finger protein
MSNETPQVAGTSPKAVELEAGKKYAFCTCGRSEDQPFCDGSHKSTSFTPHVFTAEESGQAWLCMCKHTGNVPFCDGTHKTLDQAAGS